MAITAPSETRPGRSRWRACSTGRGLAFLAGDVEQARAAYGRLLSALGAEHDEGGFPGPGTPEDLLAGDVAEAKHRYLRAVWEPEPLRTRAAALVEAADALAYVGPPAHPRVARGDPP
jgi:hypothetical protein